MDAFLTALAPHLLELIAAIATIIVGWLAAEARARWEIERWRRYRMPSCPARTEGAGYSAAGKSSAPPDAAAT